MSDTDDIRVESTIGERIRRLRHGAGMTQDDLAAAAGVSTDLIRKLEQGQRHTCSIGSLHRITVALDVDLGELLGRKSMPHAAPNAGVVALRRAVADVADLTGDVDGEPLSLRDAERSVTYLPRIGYLFVGYVLERQVGPAHRADPAGSDRTSRYAACRRCGQPA